MATRHCYKDRKRPPPLWAWFTLLPALAPLANFKGLETVSHIFGMLNILLRVQQRRQKHRTNSSLCAYNTNQVELETIDRVSRHLLADSGITPSAKYLYELDKKKYLVSCDPFQGKQTF